MSDEDEQEIDGQTEAEAAGPAEGGDENAGGDPALEEEEIDGEAAMAAAMAEASDENAGTDLALEEIDGEAAMAAAMAEEPVELEEPQQASDLEAIYDIPVQVSAVLGQATMQVSQLLKLGRGAVVELDRKVGEAIDIYVNNRLVARGEVVVVNERLGVTMTEIIKSSRSK